jgi:hypothetical protein
MRQQLLEVNQKQTKTKHEGLAINNSQISSIAAASAKQTIQCTIICFTYDILVTQ